MARSQEEIEELSICKDAQIMIEKAEKDGVVTVWDRFKAQQPQCTFCKQGLSCRNCSMGPCRIVPGKERSLGVCGANADTIVARNFGRGVAAGAAAHSDHGRDLLETLDAVANSETQGYEIRDVAKLLRIAKELGIDTEGKETLQVAKDLASTLFDEFGMRKGNIGFTMRAPEVRRKLWESLTISPRGIDREVVEMMHRTHMGVDQDPVSLFLHSARVSLSDGWGGSMVATELSDILFGTPKPVESKVNLGVLKQDEVNILVHGHSPIVSEAVLTAVRDKNNIERAKAAGANGINLAGLCCTGNELLMRQGIPMAGNHLMTELAIATGAVELVIVDYQCIMPGLIPAMNCYHTKMITTSSKAKFPGAEHVEFSVKNSRTQAQKLVEMAIELYKKRDKNRVLIPVEPVPMMSGFSNEAILEALGGSLAPLLDAIKSGKIRGVAGLVGCNNPRRKHDYCHVTLTKELIKNDILVLGTGCSAVAMGKAGLYMPEAASLAGPGLASVCKALNIPPALHVGSCVDNSRILHLCGLVAKELGVDISDLPVAGSAPEWYSEKALSIGLYFVASGVYTVLGVTPNITGSKLVTDLALDGLTNVLGACFAVETDPYKMAELMIKHINKKRKKLNLPV
jgi:carbon-monoxide dehydrogenase catalytic subunit